MSDKHNPSETELAIANAIVYTFLSILMLLLWFSIVYGGSW